MDTRTSVYDAYRHARLPDMAPVAVTRWTARLVDPQSEHDYRIDRFSEERWRGLLLMVLAGTAGGLTFFVEIYAYSRNASISMALLPPLFSIVMPILGF